MMSRYFIAGVVFLVIIAVLGGVFLWHPQYKTFLEKQEELKLKQTELAQKKQHYKEVAELYDNLVDYQTPLLKIDSAFPPTLSLPTFFYYIQKTCSETGLILEDIKVGRTITQTTPYGDMKKTLFTISGETSYPALKNFLSAAYNNSKLIEVDSLSFSVRKEETGLLSVEMTLGTNSLPKPKIKKVFVEEKTIPEEAGFPLPAEK